MVLITVPASSRSYIESELGQHVWNAIAEQGPTLQGDSGWLQRWQATQRANHHADNAIELSRSALRCNPKHQRIPMRSRRHPHCTTRVALSTCNMVKPSLFVSSSRSLLLSARSENIEARILFRGFGMWAVHEALQTSQQVVTGKSQFILNIHFKHAWLGDMCSCWRWQPLTSRSSSSVGASWHVYRQMFVSSRRNRFVVWQDFAGFSCKQLAANE